MLFPVGSMSSAERSFTGVPMDTGAHGGYSEKAQYDSPFGDQFQVRETTPLSRKKKLLIAAGGMASVVILAIILGSTLGRHHGDHDATTTSATASSSHLTSTNPDMPSLQQSTPGQAGGDSTSANPNQVAANLAAKPSLSCGADPYQFSNPSSLDVRKEHPLLIAPQYKWDCVTKLTPDDPYLSSWNKTIFVNASKYYDMSPTNYTIDGGLSGSGVLDVAREVQLRIKHWGYAYKVTKDKRWVDRTWLELQTAAGNSTTGQYFGEQGNNWNTAHFLDVGEFTAAFALAYDWLYEAWTSEQQNAIMWSIINLGLSKGIAAYGDGSAWWSRPGVQGNWNCVCNGGLILGALAIRNEDPTGSAAQMLTLAVPNIRDVCSFAPTYDNGVWQETPDYWYFGTTTHVQAAAALISATGSDQALLTANPGMKLSGNFHMYVTGATGLFDYGDTGPGKFTATANGMMFYGSQFNEARYILFQRDQKDAPEPMSMLYYDPAVSGEFWKELALDSYFSNATTSFASMRSSWTHKQGSFLAMKASNLRGHQAHGDLDAGTFVLDAIGQRWFGELGNGDYLFRGYFGGEAQGSARWTYYQKGSQGQNVLLVNEANQNVIGVPKNKFETTGEVQDIADLKLANTSTAYLISDLSSYYNATTSYKRGVRFLNGRRQVLVQDEITTTGSILWRAHTNASIAANGASATLKLGGQTLVATILSPPGATFTTVPNTRLTGQDSPSLAAGTVDFVTPGDVTVLTIALGAGTNNVQVLLNPQWPDLNANSYITPRSVPLDSWSLTSHE